MFVTVSGLDALMDGSCGDWALSVCQNGRNPKREDKEVVTNTENKSTPKINDLPDELLVDIISRLKLKDAGSTSALSRRWRYLWTFISGSLEFDVWDSDTDKGMKKRKELGGWVNRVLELHKAPRVDSFVVRSRCRWLFQDGDVDRWILFAMRKQVKAFELSLERRRHRCKDEFPSMEKLLLLGPKCSFVSLRSLKLAHVNIEDDMVHYLLATCPDLETLWINDSDCTKNLRVVAPNLKQLQLHRCREIQRVEISAPSLLSFSYAGHNVEIPYLLKSVANLRALKLYGGASFSFIYQANKHSSYSVHLTELDLVLLFTPFLLPFQIAVPPDLPQLCSLGKLTVKTTTPPGRSLIFFTLLIKASPRLREFEIMMNYECESGYVQIPFPEVSEAEVGTFNHANLRSVQMGSYCGSTSEDAFLLKLLEMAPSLETVIINTEWRDYEYEHESRYLKKMKLASTRDESKERARNLKSKFPPHTQLLII